MEITLEDIAAICGAFLGVTAVLGAIGQWFLKPFIRSNTEEIRNAMREGFEKVNDRVSDLESSVNSTHRALEDHMTQERVTTAVIQQQLTAHEGSINTLGAVLGMTWRKGPEWQSITSPVQSGALPTSVLVTPVITNPSEDSSSTTP